MVVGGYLRLCCKMPRERQLCGRHYHLLCMSHVGRLLLDPHKASVPWPASRTAAVVQAGKHRDVLFAQQFEMQRIREPSKQNPAKPSPSWRKRLWVARQLFFGRSDDPQKIATQTMGPLLVPIKSFGYFSLSCWFNSDLPSHRRTPSDCAISARLLPCPG